MKDSQISIIIPSELTHWHNVHVGIDLCIYIDIHVQYQHTGSKYTHRVLSVVASDLLQCQCIRKLLPFLVAHNVLTNEAYAVILIQPESEDAVNLHRVLTGIAAEPDSQKMIENLYLSLLDCYESSQNTWCWHMATVTWRQAGKVAWSFKYLPMAVNCFSFSYSPFSVESAKYWPLW